MTEESLFEILGTPETKTVTRLDGKPLGANMPRQMVKTVTWNGWIDEDEEDLRILDFGEAFPHVEQCCQDLGQRSFL